MRYRSRNYHGLTLDIISAVLFYLSVVIMVILISLRLHEDVYIIHYLNIIDLNKIFNYIHSSIHHIIL